MSEEIVESSSEGRLSRLQRKMENRSAGPTTIYFFSEEWTSRYEDNQIASTIFRKRDLCVTSLVSGVCQSGASAHIVQNEITTRQGLSWSGNFVDLPGQWGTYGGTLTLQGEVRSEVAVSDFTNDTANWVIGFRERLEVENDSTVPGAPITSSAVFTKDGTTAAVKTSKAFPGDQDLELLSTFTRNAKGQIVNVRVEGEEVAVRDVGRSSFEWDRFPKVTTDPYGRDLDSEYDLRFGLPSSIEYPDGLVDSFQYDEIGRLATSTSASSDLTSVTRTNCNSTSLCNSITWGDPSLVEEIAVSNNSATVQPTQRIYYGSRGEILLQETEAFDNADGWRRVEQHFDVWGRTSKISLPYYSVGETPKFVQYRYDEQSRTVREERPDTSWTKTDYTFVSPNIVALTTESILTAGVGSVTQQKQAVFNVAGELTSIKDAFGHADEVETTYTYTKHGLLNIVRVNGDAVAILSYDDAGNRTLLFDPSTGTTTFKFSALGELIESTDNIGQLTEFDYDLLGRLKSQGEDCSVACTTMRTWNYDPSNGYGQIESAAGPGLTTTYTYNSQGLLGSVSSNVSVSGFSDNGARSISYSYADGRVSDVTFPGSQSFDFEYEDGYLARVRNGLTVIDEVEELHAFGVVTRRTLGNGLITRLGIDSNTGDLTSIESGTASVPASVQDLEYVWRSNSSLYRRTDMRPTNDYQETMTYDGLNRLKRAEESLSNRRLDFEYDPFGNLETKTSNKAGDLDVTSYANTVPYELLSANIGSVATTFGYDLNGNITSYNAIGTSNDKAITYDAGNRATRISVGSTVTPTAEDEFWYGPEGQRFLRKASWLDGSTTKVSWTVYLFDGLYEEVVPSHDTTTNKYRKVQITDSVLFRTRVPSVGVAQSTTEYQLRDHLGSVDVVTSSSQAVLHRTSFDAFGGRRESDWSADVSVANLDLILNDVELNTARGFTDHEMLDRTGLVHMNGRIYDSQLGRFLQPDPIVQSPGFSQSYNRYAYVFNSPLSFTDPTGFMSAAPEPCPPNATCSSKGFIDFNAGQGAFALLDALDLRDQVRAEQATSLLRSIVDVFGRTASESGVVITSIGTIPLDPEQRDLEFELAFEGGLIVGSVAGGGIPGLLARGAVGSATVGTLTRREALASLIATTAQTARARAGFSEVGVPVILDTNLAARGFAEALRARGFNVRSVREIFGKDPGDPTINRLANTIGARVLTRDRGRQIGEGFERNAIQVDARVRSIDVLARVLENGL